MHLNCVWKQTFPHWPPRVCCYSWVSRGLRSPPPSSILHFLLSTEVPGFRLRRVLFFPPVAVMYATSQSCTWDNETQAFYSNPCCVPETNPDPNSHFILSNSRINCGIRVEQQRADGETKGRTTWDCESCQFTFCTSVSFVNCWFSFVVL